MITRPHGSGRRGPWVLLAAALCHAAPAWAEPPEGESRSTALRFAWPAKLEAEVEYRRSKFEPGRPERNTAVALTARLNAVITGNEVRIAYRGWKGELGADPLARALLQSSDRIVTVVSRSGAFLRVEGTTAVEDAVKQMPGLDRVPAQGRQQLLQVAPAVLQKEAQDVWGALVGVWAGNDLEIGADYEMEGEARSRCFRASGSGSTRGSERSGVSIVPARVGRDASSCASAPSRTPRTPTGSSRRSLTDSAWPILQPASVT